MRNIFAHLGILLEVFALFLIFPLIAALAFGEPAAPYFTGALLSLLLGLYFDKTNKREELGLNEALTLTALAFILISVIGSIPYIYYFSDFGSYRLVDSIFESVSGFTTTGLSVFSTVEGLPKSLLFFRAETQWLGGIGIIIVFLAVLSEFKTSAMSLYRAQGYSSRIGETIKDTTRKMIKIYGAYTLAGTALLLVAGLSFFESVSLTFSAISTGGFSVKDYFYSDPFVLAIVSILMIFGATSFFVHDRAFRGQIDYFLRNAEFRTLLFMIFLFSAITFMALPDLPFVIFHIVSAFTTTGFSFSSANSIPNVFTWATIVAMFIGGASASTAGGLKISRVIVLLKSIPWLVKKMIYPGTAMIPIKVEGAPVDEEVITTAGIFTATYIFAALAGSAVFLFLGYSMTDSVFQIISALSTVGMTTINIGAVPIIGKATLVVCMILGRLEIFPVLILLNNMIKRE